MEINEDIIRDKELNNYLNKIWSKETDTHDIFTLSICDIFEEDLDPRTTFNFVTKKWDFEIIMTVKDGTRIYSCENIHPDFLQNMADFCYKFICEYERVTQMQDIIYK